MRILALMLVLGICSVANADNIRYKTENKQAEIQDFRCKILRIDTSYVSVVFRHMDKSDTVMIHISRVRSISFNKEYEHPNAYLLRSNVFQQVQGNITRLRDMRVWSSFAEDYPDVECQWTGVERKIRANIISYDDENNLLVIRYRTKERVEKEVTLEGTDEVIVWSR